MQIMRSVVCVAVLASLGLSSASAQQPQTVRIRGTVEKVDGNTVAVKATDGAALTLTLTANAAIIGIVKATLADIKPGSFVGSAAMPQADGSQKALEVHIFAESQRGTGEKDTHVTSLRPAQNADTIAWPAWRGCCQAACQAARATCPWPRRTPRSRCGPRSARRSRRSTSAGRPWGPGPKRTATAAARHTSSPTTCWP